jgi:hypothetical protein
MWLASRLQFSETLGTACRCLYVTNQNGATIVFRAGPEKYEQLAENKLDESTSSTIAISDGEVFLRTAEHLFCIAEK